MATVILSGNTYKARDAIKRFQSAKWDAARKAWTMSAEAFDEFRRTMPSLSAGITATPADADIGQF